MQTPSTFDETFCPPYSGLGQGPEFAPNERIATYFSASK